MDVRAVFHLNSLLEIRHQSPKFLLNVIFGNWSMTIENRVDWHLIFEVVLLERSSLLLELLQGVKASLFKTKLAITDEATGAIPLILRLCLDWGVEACAMVAVVARFTHQEEAAFVATFSALFAFLSKPFMSIPISSRQHIFSTYLSRGCGLVTRNPRR
jgi:hypothetical protein